MDWLTTTSGSIAGVLIGVAWIAIIVLVVGKLAFAGRRRAMRRGTYPVRLLPWFLGGTPEMPLPHSEDGRQTKSRRS